MRIARPDDLTDLATLGLSMAEGKQLLAGVQQELVAAQARRHAARRPACRSCSTTCRVKDYRQHAIATLFGQVAVRLPRYCCVGCGVTEAGLGWPSHIRSTPELDRLRAQLAALCPIGRPPRCWGRCSRWTPARIRRPFAVTRSRSPRRSQCRWR